MKTQKNWYKPTIEEQKNILMALLETSEGYRRAHELYDAVIQNYNPIEYAVKHTREQIETRQYMPWINKRKVGQPNKVDKQETINRRNKKWQKYYGDKRWKQLREWQIRTHPLCQDCLFEGRSVPAEEVHHIRPFGDGKTEEEKWSLLLDPSNTVSLCKTCHDKRHAILKQQNRNDYI